MKKLDAYLRLMRMHRPIGAFLLLWPTLWALWLAGDGNPDSTIVLIFIAGTFLMRAAGCVINDYADRNYDPYVERTQDRPLAAKEVSVKEAIGVFLVLLLGAFVLVLFLNELTIKLSFFALFIAVLYPFVKRISHLPQLVLGIAFSWGIPMSYTAITNTLPPEAWLIFVANFFWTVAYDTQYAMADREEDLRIGVKSTAILFGSWDNRIIGSLHFVTLGLLAWIGWLNELSWHYYFGLFLASLFAIYQQYLCKDRVKGNCFAAFLNNNWFGAMVFFGLVLGL